MHSVADLTSRMWRSRSRWGAKFIDLQASGLCHTDLLFATHDIVPTPSVLGHEVAGIVAGRGGET